MASPNIGKFQKAKKNLSATTRTTEFFPKINAITFDTSKPFFYPLNFERKKYRRS